MNSVDIETAEKVFGWKAKYPEMEPGDHFSARGDDFKYGFIKARYPNGMTEKEFSPSLKINHAYMVIDEMRKKGFRMARVEYSDGVYIKFSNDKIEEGDWLASQFHPTKEPLAICNAAVIALGHNRIA